MIIATPRRQMLLNKVDVFEPAVDSFPRFSPNLPPHYQTFAHRYTKNLPVSTEFSFSFHHGLSLFSETMPDL